MILWTATLALAEPPTYRQLMEHWSDAEAAMASSDADQRRRYSTLSPGGRPPGVASDPGPCDAEITTKAPLSVRWTCDNGVSVITYDRQDGQLRWTSSRAERSSVSIRIGRSSDPVPRTTQAAVPRFGARIADETPGTAFVVEGALVDLEEGTVTWGDSERWAPATWEGGVLTLGDRAFHLWQWEERWFVGFPTLDLEIDSRPDTVDTRRAALEEAWATWLERHTTPARIDAREWGPEPAIAAARMEGWVAWLSGGTVSPQILADDPGLDVLAAPIGFQASDGVVVHASPDDLQRVRDQLAAVDGVEVVSDPAVPVSPHPYASMQFAAVATVLGIDNLQLQLDPWVVVTHPDGVWQGPSGGVAGPRLQDWRAGHPIGWSCGSVPLLIGSKSVLGASGAGIWTGRRDDGRVEGRVALSIRAGRVRSDEPCTPSADTSWARAIAGQTDHLTFGSRVEESLEASRQQLLRALGTPDRASNIRPRHPLGGPSIEVRTVWVDGEPMADLHCDTCPPLLMDLPPSVASRLKRERAMAERVDLFMRVRAAERSLHPEQALSLLGAPTVVDPDSPGVTAVRSRLAGLVDLSDAPLSADIWLPNPQRALMRPERQQVGAWSERSDVHYFARDRAQARAWTDRLARMGLEHPVRARKLPRAASRWTGPQDGWLQISSEAGTHGAFRLDDAPDLDLPKQDAP